MIHLVLPAYNEAGGLPELLTEAQAALSQGGEYQVIVVDDGSSDGTADIASERATTIPLKLVRHERNRGLAAALRTGLQTAIDASSPGDLIVTMDADNTHKPEQIAQMLPAIERGADVVIASRYRRGAKSAGLSPFRALLSRGAGVLFQVVMPTRGVRDYTCGFRTYRSETLRRAMERYGDGFITQQGFACMVEVLLRMRAMGAVMCEVPLNLRYDLKVGVSKMNVRKTVCDTLKLLLRWRLGLQK